MGSQVASVQPVCLARLTGSGNLLSRKTVEKCRDYCVSASPALDHFFHAGISSLFQNSVIPTMRGPVHQGTEQNLPDLEHLLSLSIPASDLKVPITFSGFLNRFRRPVDLIIFCYHDSDLE